MTITPQHIITSPKLSLGEIRKIKEGRENSVDVFCNALLCVVFCFAIVAFGLTTVVLANSAPQFSAITDQYLSEGQTMTLNISASDADGDPLILGMSRRPNGVSFTDNGDGSATCRFTAEYLGPNSSMGSPIALEFFASDGSITITEQIDLIVLNVNRRPSITAPDTVFVEVGDTVDFVVNSSDPDLDPVSWTSPLLPSGARLESASGTAFANFQWAPLDLDSGVSTVNFIATDYWGASDTATTTVVVTIGAPFTLSISTDTAFPGELIQIAVALKNREAISEFELVVHVDPSVMSVLSLSRTASRTADFESFLYTLNTPTLGDIKITASASEGLTLSPGDGPLFVMNTVISSQVGLAGFFLPVNFVFRTGSDPNDNTMTDEVGAQISVSEIIFVNGGTKVKEPAEINRGDINLNGIPFEVADALRFTNYFIDPTLFGFDAQQYANSDINIDGIVASVADLVTLLAIVTGASSSRIIPSIQSGDSMEEFSKEPQAIFVRESYTNVHALTLGSTVAIGGVYFEASIEKNTYASAISASQEIFTLSAAALAANMIIDQRYDNTNTVRVLIYSLENGSLSANVSGLASELVSWDNSDIAVVSFENIEVSSADGVLLEVAYSSGTDEVAIPNTFALHQNYPNPFNPSTKISFSLAGESDVTLVVYDLLGRTVKTLVRANFAAGSHEVIWDGRDNHGSVVASGVYFYRLKSGEKTLTRKMALLK